MAVPHSSSRARSAARRPGAGGRIALAAVAALGAACLAGSPLYLSSVATGALRDELGHTCLADVGLVVSSETITDSELAELDAAARPLARHTSAPVLTRLAVVFVGSGGEGELPTRAYLVTRPGQEAQVGRPVPTPAAGEVIPPEWLGAPEVPRAGDALHLFNVSSTGAVVWEDTVRVAGTYPAVPTRPEPPFWCGLRALFRSSTADPADPPTPVLLTGIDELAKVGPAHTFDLWEVRPDPRTLTRHDAGVLAERLDALLLDARHIVVVGNARSGLHDAAALRLVVRHAGVAASVVAGTMAPVRLAGLLAAAALLLAAATLATRQRQRELHLRLMKGSSPVALGARSAGANAAPVVAGALAGGVLALAAVRGFGPAQDLEAAAVRAAIVQTAIGIFAALLMVTLVGAARVAVLVDGGERHRRWWRFVPWEVAPVAAAVAAFARLDRIGGIQQIGATVAHADLAAQSFPLLAIAAPLAVLARPLTMRLRRWRLAGRRLPPSLMIGLRRALGEPAVTASVLLTTALAAGSFSLARTLTDSASTMLDDKATAYIGSDLAVTSRGVVPLPPPLDRTGTVVLRAQGHSGSQSVDVLGVDPATFARAVHWRADAADVPLDALLASVTRGAAGPMPALVVHGTLSDTTLVSLTGQTITVRPSAAAGWFPGYHNGAVMVVVDRSSLAASSFTPATEIWLRDPPRDAVEQLTGAGIPARSPVDVAFVFDVTSFLTVRWGYATLSVLAVLIGVVVLLAQVLVLDARLQQRRAAHVLTARMGLGWRGEALGLLAEIAPPLVVGTMLGTGIGLLVARLSVARLDSLRQLEPAARLVVEPALLLTPVAAMAGALVVLAATGLAMVQRTRAMEVMRGTA